MTDVTVGIKIMARLVSIQGMRQALSIQIQVCGLHSVYNIVDFGMTSLKITTKHYRKVSLQIKQVQRKINK